MSNSKTAIPLCLPNNCHWDPQTGEYSKTADVERDKLHAVAKALQKLREIKGPVCVVTIAGPCRKGKSYILSKAFDQGEVFPIGSSAGPRDNGYLDVGGTGEVHWQERTGIHCGAAGLRRNWRGIRKKDRRPSSFHPHCPVGFGHDLQLCWRTDKNWPGFTGVSGNSDTYLDIC